MVLDFQDQEMLGFASYWSFFLCLCICICFFFFYKIKYIKLAQAWGRICNAWKRKVLLGQQLRFSTVIATKIEHREIEEAVVVMWTVSFSSFPRSYHGQHGQHSFIRSFSSDMSRVTFIEQKSTCNKNLCLLKMYMIKPLSFYSKICYAEVHFVLTRLSRASRMVPQPDIKTRASYWSKGARGDWHKLCRVSNGP